MNQITKGRGAFGALTVGTTATVASLNATALAIAGSSLTATSTELNESDQSVQGAKQKWKTIDISGASLGSSEMDTGWALPSRCIVHDVLVRFDVGTSGSATMSVGLLATTSGNADGFLAALPTSSEGYSTPVRTGALTATSSGWTAAYWGLLLAPAVATNTTANIQMTRKLDLFLDAGTSSKNISYTMSSTANDSFDAAILIRYTELV